MIKQVNILKRKLNLISFLIIPFCLLLSTSVQSAETELTTLQKGWKEYEFRNFGFAEDLFEEAAEKAVNDKDYCQAMVGRAFCYQFGKKGQVSVSDYKYAISLYKNALNKASKNKKLTNFLKSMIAECLLRISQLSKDREIKEEAETYWAELKKEAGNSVVAQDAMLTKTIAQTDDFTDPKLKPLVSELESFLKPIVKSLEKKDPQTVSEINKKFPLAKIMANFLGFYYFWNKDYPASIHWFKIYYILGPTSYAAKANTIFTIARIAELKLKDKKLATEFYQKFAKETGNDRRAYFAEEKVKQLSKEPVSHR